MVPLRRPPLHVAFDAASLTGAAFARGFSGPRLQSFARVPLDDGALLPSAANPNLLRPREVKDALKRLGDELGRGGRSVLVLPDGSARLLLLEATGDDLREYARFRLASALPYPVAEAIVDVLPVGGGRVLAAAVRRTIVEEYEAAAADAGFPRERVGLAPLVALAGALKRERDADVHAFLGEASLSLAALDAQGLRAFRQRRRDPGPGEARRLFDEAVRTVRAGHGEPGAGLRLSLSGAGAASLADELTAAGRAVLARPSEGPAQTSEVAWLAGLLA
jgi:hypothetical protein